MYREAFAACSQAALKNNLQRIRTLACGARPIAVVKANAYGHGLAPVVRALTEAGADFFAVARLSEALALRKLSPSADILILGYTAPSDAPLLARHGLIQAVHSPAYAHALSETANQPIRAHLKLDVGMGRYGISIYKSGAFRDAMQTLSTPRLLFEAVFSHLPSADLPLDTKTDAQRRSFHLFHRRLLASHPLRRHLLASAGLLRYSGDREDFVRPGLALYGYAPGKSLSHEGFLPVLRLYAPVVAIRELSRGDRIGYGGEFVASRAMRVALLGIGYGDGLCRSLSGASVSLGGKRCPIVGRICMDLTFCALPDAASVRIGDLALVFGDTQNELLRLAEHADTIPYELLTSLSARLCRYVSP